MDNKPKSISTVEAIRRCCIIVALTLVIAGNCYSNINQLNVAIILISFAFLISKIEN